MIKSIETKSGSVEVEEISVISNIEEIRLFDTKLKNDEFMNKMVCVV